MYSESYLHTNCVTAWVPSCLLACLSHLVMKTEIQTNILSPDISPALFACFSNQHVLVDMFGDFCLACVLLKHLFAIVIGHNTARRDLSDIHDG